MSDRNNEAGLIKAFTRRQAIVGATAAIGGAALLPTESWAGADDEVSQTAEAIHQEPVFTASRKRLYEALTQTKQFDQVIQLSGAVKSGMALGTAPTKISRAVGGTFTLFGGYISGRHIELVPNERIVQAWRTAKWDPGVYSIVKFELVEQGSGTMIVFDHAGFPKGEGEHLAAGWKMNYWEPLEKFLA